MKEYNCLRCGRTLGADRSMERGYGPRCWSKILRAMEQAHADEKVRQLFVDHAITPFKGDVAVTVSARDGRKYLSHPSTCNCPGGLYRPHMGSCYHQKAALVLKLTKEVAK